MALTKRQKWDLYREKKKRLLDSEKEHGIVENADREEIRNIPEETVWKPAEDWKEGLSDFDRFEPIRYLEGYADPASVTLPEVSRPKTPEEFRAMAADLKNYEKLHPRQLEQQTLRIVLFDRADLPLAENKAWVLRNSISEKIRSGIAAKLSKEEEKELLNIWIYADAFYHSAGAVLEYASKNKRNGLSDLFDSFLKEGEEMELSFQERWSRRHLTMVFWEYESRMTDKE